MHELKCELCSCRVMAFSPAAVATLLDEHMDLKHPTQVGPKHGEDMRLTLEDAKFLHSVGVAPWQ